MSAIAKVGWRWLDGTGFPCPGSPLKLQPLHGYAWVKWQRYFGVTIAREDFRL